MILGGNRSHWIEWTTVIWWGWYSLQLQGTTEIPLISTVLISPLFSGMKFLCASEIIPVWRYPQLSLEVPGWAVMWAACAQCCGQLQTLCRLAGKFGWEGRAWASQTLHVLRVHSRSGNPCGNHKMSPSSSQFRLSLAQGCAQCNFYCFQGSRFSISLSPKFDHPHGEICLVH